MDIPLLLKSEVILRGSFTGRWSDQGAFDYIQKIEGELAKAKDNRRVTKFEFEGNTYYLKHHVGVGWKEIIKNLLQFKLPVLGARNEWDALETLAPSSIYTMEAVAFGQHGINPAKQESFLITRELKDTISLEKLCLSWRHNPPAYTIKKALIEKVARMARTLRDLGLNHRDFYLCHILLDVSDGIENIDPEKIKIYLVDLHRMQQRRKVPERWLVKDIGSLYFSALDIGLTRRDILRFLLCYDGKKTLLSKNIDFWKQVKSRAQSLQKKVHKYKADFPL